MDIKIFSIPYKDMPLYYCSIVINERFTHDSQIINEIGLSKHEFRKIMKEQFNAIYNNKFMNGEVFFKSEDDAYKAKEWIESCSIIKNLTKKPLINPVKSKDWSSI